MGCEKMQTQNFCCHLADKVVEVDCWKMVKMEVVVKFVGKIEVEKVLVETDIAVDQKE